MRNKNTSLAHDAALKDVTERYAVSITDDVYETFNPANPNDPVARQYRPSLEELVTTPDELNDPIGDDAHSPVKGIVHRYPDRVLLKPLHVCAVYCRFCFRREKVGPESEYLKAEELEAALDYIRNTPAIWEVILTGGDPLLLSPRRLRGILEALEKIDHVEVIRLHTRIPVAAPSRVTDEMVQAMVSAKAVYIVVHCNHANELTDKVKQATLKILKAGIPLLSQSVLLKGVNDTQEALEALFRRLTSFRIKPYYLHHPDKAVGTSHFRLPLDEGENLVKSLWGKMSGIAQPRYVLDIPKGAGKVPVSPAYIRTESAGKYTVSDYQGNPHIYLDDETT